MKLLISATLVTGLLLFIACKKDPPTLNEQLEGNWRVVYYDFYGSSIPEYIKNGIAFKSEGPTKGTIFWSEHRDLGGTKDTVSGPYTLNENTKTMHIKWKNLIYAYGMTKGKDYLFSLSQDSLTLTWPDTFINTLIYTQTMRAVRD